MDSTTDKLPDSVVVVGVLQQMKKDLVITVGFMEQAETLKHFTTEGDVSAV